MGEEIGHQRGVVVLENANKSAPESNTQKTVNVLKDAKDSINKELEDSRWPWLIGLLALAIGGFLWLEGSNFFRVSVHTSVAVLCGILAKQSALSYWEQHDDGSYEVSKHIMASIVGVEVGVVAFFASEKGFHGIMAIIGAIGGCFIARFLNELMVHVTPHFHDVEVMIVWYTAIVVAAVWFVHTGRYKHILAIVTPFIGGAFMSSALLFFITEAMIHGGCTAKTKATPAHACAGLTPVRGQWYAFFLMGFQHLVSKKDDVDVGIFAQSHMNWKMSGEHEGHSGVVYGDHIFILFFWLIFWGVGWMIQTKKLKKYGLQPPALGKGGRAASAREARGALTENLLQVEE